MAMANPPAHSFVNVTTASCSSFMSVKVASITPASSSMARAMSPTAKSISYPGSKLYAMLEAGHNKVKLTDDEMRRLTIWMDSNGLFHGHDQEVQAQAEGKIIPPILQ